MTQNPQSVDPDDDLTPYERIRRCAHRDITRICQTWPQARLDAQARGYGTGRTFDGTSRGGSELTSVEAAASHQDFATGWIAELGDVLMTIGLPSTVQESDEPQIHISADTYCAEWPKGANQTLKRLHYLAEQAFHYWPDPPKRGQTVQGVTIGGRTNTVENCALCNEPVVSGKDEAGNALLRRDKDGMPFHAAGKGCYWQVWRQRRKETA